MSRWRPPREPSAAYITPEGYASLQAEYEALWQRRKGVAAAITAAAAEGDRSENAEYIYRKKELRGIDSRIGYLQRRMPTLKIVKTVASDEQVFFGAWVQLEDAKGEQTILRIVGGDEIGPPNYISLDSPMAKQLLKKHVDDDVVWSRAEQDTTYRIVAIAYGAINPF